MCFRKEIGENFSKHQLSTHLLIFSIFITIVMDDVGESDVRKKFEETGLEMEE